MSLSSWFPSLLLLFFFFNDTATTEIYTLSLHDALPIYPGLARSPGAVPLDLMPRRSSTGGLIWPPPPDRKSTRLNSSHTVISYAVFCLKKKKNTNTTPSPYGEPTLAPEKTRARFIHSPT